MKRIHRLSIIGAVGASFAITDVASAQKRYPLDLQIMPVQLSTRRNVEELSGTVREQTGTLKGVEVSVLGKSSGVGIFGRVHQGQLGTTTGRQLLEGGFMIGEKAFRLQFAYSERRGTLIDTTYQLVSGGFQAVSDLGSSGVALKLRALFMIPPDKFKGESSKNKLGDGWEGETAVTYTWNRLPIFAQVGYRFERLRLMPRDQETSALILGAGIWMRP